MDNTSKEKIITNLDYAIGSEKGYIVYFKPIASENRCQAKKVFYSRNKKELFDMISEYEKRHDVKSFKILTERKFREGMNN